jgi:hypothetical protein
MRTDGRTDRHTYMTKLPVAFRNFANAPKTHFYVTVIVTNFVCKPKSEIIALYLLARRRFTHLMFFVADTIVLQGSRYGGMSLIFAYKVATVLY